MKHWHVKFDVGLSFRISCVCVIQWRRKCQTIIMSAHGVFSISTTDDDLVIFASESVAFAPICCVIMTLPKPDICRLLGDKQTKRTESSNLLCSAVKAQNWFLLCCTAWNGKRKNEAYRCWFGNVLVKYAYLYALFWFVWILCCCRFDNLFPPALCP